MSTRTARDLSVLEENSNALLLAEAVGWLHNYRKCSEEHIRSHAKNGKGDEGESNEQNEQKEPESRIASLLKDVTLKFTIAEQEHSLSVLKLLERKCSNNGLLKKYLNRCHKAAHFDKQEEKQEDKEGKQSYPGTKISTPFGYETDVPEGLTEALWQLPWDCLADFNEEGRQKLRKDVEKLFSKALADTRRPINEVDLWSWGLLVGSLYKAALARALLTGDTPEEKDLKWRLLGVRVRGVDYMLGASRIPDLLARRKVLESALDRVKALLEVKYPLGSEVYRDENGSVYVVPDVEGLLEVSDGNGSCLKTLIEREFCGDMRQTDAEPRIEGELVPDIRLEEEAWWGQDPEYMEKTRWKKHEKYGQPPNDKLPKINCFVSQCASFRLDPEKIKSFWQDSKADICTVCGLRPQGSTEMAKAQRVCNVCHSRRVRRAREWAEELSGAFCRDSDGDLSRTTIWTGEVVDSNGRLALIVGRLHLDGWMSGKYFASLYDVKKEGKEVCKTPSFSRLRRMWETARVFWENVQNEIVCNIARENAPVRLLIKAAGLERLVYQVFDMDLNGVDMDVVPVLLGNEMSLVSTSNLKYIARRLGAKEADFSDSRLAANFVMSKIEKKIGSQVVLRCSDGRPGRDRRSVERVVSVKGVEIFKGDKETYSPTIPVMASPRTFMAFVPADKSVEVVRKIKEKYESEMGKVRDRLPLSLGVVYADRHTPVRSMLEAGRAMIERKINRETWSVANRSIVPKNGKSVRRITFERRGRSLALEFPFMMGDDKTEDKWYPHLFVPPEGDAASKNCPVKHVTSLEPGDKVYISPSTFDFEYLDTNARRFDVCYDESGHRPGATKPYYLEDFDRIESVWEELKVLSRTQLKQVVSSIESAREEWFGPDRAGKSFEDHVFRRFVEDTLANADWPRHKKWSNMGEKQKDIVCAAVRGELADMAELHMEILKEK